MKKLLFIAITIMMAFALKLKGQPGAALNFDGVNDQVLINNSTLGAFTIEFWMRTTQVAPVGSQWHFGNGLVDAEITGVQNDFGVALLGTKVAFGIGNPDITIVSTSNVNTGNWVHVAAVFTSASGGYSELYINGIQEVGSTAPAPNARNTNGQIAFGRAKSKLQFYNGDLDEVRIWNYTRSLCQIQNSMFCELTATEPGLLYYYQFNQGLAAANNTTITTITNLMGGNNGTITSMALNGSTSNFIAPGAVVSGVTCSPISVNVQGNGNNIIDNATTTTTLNATSFGTVCSSSTPITNIYTIQNNGTAVLTLNTFNLTGTNANSFSITSVTPSSIAVGASATLAINFLPTTIGANLATFAFNTNNCAFPTYNFALGATVIGSPIITVNSGSICSGNSFLITPTGATNYTFSGGSATVSPNTTTGYTVTGVDAQGCFNSNSAVSNVTVITTPTITVNSGTICTGQSFTMTPSGATSYTFSGGTAIVNPLTNTSYSVTGSNNNCLSANTAIANVTVNPTPTITTSVANATICSGESNTLTANGATNYTWTPGNITGNTISVTPTTNITYTVKGADAFCSDTKTISIVVNALPNVTITGSNSVCIGNSITLTGSGATSYLWNTSATTNIVSVAPTVNTTYTVTGTGINGCQKTATTTITANAVPTVSATSGTICSGQSFTILASGANTYTYSGGNAVVTPSITTNYSVTGTSAQGCISANTAISTISVNPLPTINAVSNSSLICIGQTVTLTATGANTYTWSNNAINSVIIVSPPVNTTYTVTGTNSNNCYNSATIIQNVSTCTDIKTIIANSAGLRVYPNPVMESLIIETAEKMSIQLSDLSGKIILSKEVSEAKTTIDMSEFANGIYFLRTDKINYLKIIKQ